MLEKSQFDNAQCAATVEREDLLGAGIEQMRVAFTGTCWLV